MAKEAMPEELFSQRWYALYVHGVGDNLLRSMVAPWIVRTLRGFTFVANPPGPRDRALSRLVRAAVYYFATGSPRSKGPFASRQAWRRRGLGDAGARLPA